MNLYRKLPIFCLIFILIGFPFPLAKHQKTFQCLINSYVGIIFILTKVVSMWFLIHTSDQLWDASAKGSGFFQFIDCFEIYVHIFIIGAMSVAAVANCKLNAKMLKNFERALKK